MIVILCRGCGSLVSSILCLTPSLSLSLSLSLVSLPYAVAVFLRRYARDFADEGTGELSQRILDKGLERLTAFKVREGQQEGVIRVRHRKRTHTHTHTHNTLQFRDHLSHPTQHRPSAPHHLTSAPPFLIENRDQSWLQLLLRCRDAGAASAPPPASTQHACRRPLTPSICAAPSCRSFARPRTAPRS